MFERVRNVGAGARARHCERLDLVLHVLLVRLAFEMTVRKVAFDRAVRGFGARPRLRSRVLAVRKLASERVSVRAPKRPPAYGALWHLVASLVTSPSAGAPLSQAMCLSRSHNKHHVASAAASLLMTTGSASSRRMAIGMLHLFARACSSR